MRRSGPWQSVWDDRILEWIRENDGAGTASEMKDSDLIRISRSQISRRLKKLNEHGLVRDVGNGAYILTDEGEAYLNEEYDADRGMYLEDMSSADESSPAESSREPGTNGV